MEKIVLDILKSAIQLKETTITNSMDRIFQGADRMAECVASGHKVMLFGNGGSAADAQHIAAEFVNRFQMERGPLAGLALTTDTSVITSIGNDYSFDEIFSKQVIALGRQDDIALGISTSGNSKNVVRAIMAARDMGMFTIGFTGRGGALESCCDLLFPVESDVTARIQEVHIFIGHILCDLMERILFPENAPAPV